LFPAGLIYSELPQIKPLFGLTSGLNSKLIKTEIVGLIASYYQMVLLEEQNLTDKSLNVKKEYVCNLLLSVNVPFKNLDVHAN